MEYTVSDVYTHVHYAMHSSTLSTGWADILTMAVLTNFNINHLYIKNKNL